MIHYKKVILLSVILKLQSEDSDRWLVVLREALYAFIEGVALSMCYASQLLRCNTHCIITRNKHDKRLSLATSGGRAMTQRSHGRRHRRWTSVATKIQCGVIMVQSPRSFTRLSLVAVQPQQNKARQTKLRLGIYHSQQAISCESWLDPKH